VQRGELLAQLVVQVAGDARPLVLARRLEVFGEASQVAGLSVDAALECLVEAGQFGRRALERE
jgi:hypothetical protein